MRNITVLKDETNVHTGKNSTIPTYRRWLTLALLCLSVLPGMLFSQDEGAAGGGAGWAVSWELTSRYIWRGMDLMPDNTPAVQPSLTYVFGKSGLSFNLWASFAVTGRETYKYEDQVLLTLNYDIPVSEQLSLSLGFTNYGFYSRPGYTFKDGNSQEFYAAACLTKVIFQPTLSVYYDVNLGSGVYFSLSAGHTINLSSRTALVLNGSIGYNGRQWVDDSGLSDLLASAGVSVSLGKVNLFPYIRYSHVFLDALNTGKDEFWFGVVFSI